jgi:hypothetical protein
MVKAARNRESSPTPALTHWITLVGQFSFNVWGCVCLCTAVVSFCCGPPLWGRQTHSPWHTRVSSRWRGGLWSVVRGRKGRRSELTLHIHYPVLFRLQGS